MPLHVPVPAVALEGDYSTWTHKWTKEFPSGPDNAYPYIAFHIIENKEYFAMAWQDGSSDYRFGVYKLEDMSVILQSVAGSDYTRYFPVPSGVVAIAQTVDSYGGISASRNRYLVLLRDYATTPIIEIWKDGALKQTIDLGDYVTDCNEAFFHFSLTGKYLLVATSWPARILLFEGS